MHRQIINAVAEALGWNAEKVRSQPVSGGSIAGSYHGS